MRKNVDLVMGFMIESNLVEGKQKLVFGQKYKLDWGKSITDSCIGLEETDNLLNNLFNAV
jgi:3-deoxy-7-phosphoheptulonate synthase